jgi:small-conductance mechanosensitive channel
VLASLVQRFLQRRLLPHISMDQRQQYAVVQIAGYLGGAVAGSDLHWIRRQRPEFELRVWTIWQVQTPRILTSALYFSIFRAFRENGIEIPFPQRDLHLRFVHVPLAVHREAGWQPYSRGNS